MDRPRYYLLVGATVGFVLALALALAYFLLPAEEVGQRAAEEEEAIVHGVVSSVSYRVNQAEDGYYEFTVTTPDGHSHVVNATGYMNTPLAPEENGEECLPVPKPETLEGARVSFLLPPWDNGFALCFPQEDSTAYFLSVE